MKPTDISFIFFGTSDFSVHMLEALYAQGFIPKLIVCAPDKPRGRKLEITPPPTKVWATKYNIPVFQPQSLKKKDVREELYDYARTKQFDLFIVVSYGLIIPEYIIDIPQKGVLNVHPSLLPKLRGASPIESTILTGEQPGTTIMKIDEHMDHGPIIAQKVVKMSDPIPYRKDLYAALVDTSGPLLTHSIIPWLEGAIEEQEQDHSRATFCSKFSKEDALLDLSDEPEKNLRKIRAFSGFLYAFFLDSDKKGKEIRVKVTHAHLENNTLVIEKVIPEGKKEMTFDEYINNIKG